MTDAPSFLLWAAKMQSQARQAARPAMILREHPKLRDVWPPEPGGAVASGFRSPQGGVDILEQVFYYAPVDDAKADVALLTKYEGQSFTRDLLLTDPQFARDLATWFRGQIGKSIQEIGQLTLNLEGSPPPIRA